MSNEVLGFTKYATLYAESTWGTKPGSPTYIHVPVTNYGVRFRPENRQASLFTGILAKKHSTNHRGMPSGTLAAPLFGYKSGGYSLAQHLIDWATNPSDPNAVELASKGVQWAEGPNVSNMEHNGLRVNQMTLAGSSDNGIIEVTLDLIGKSEAALGSAQAVPNNLNKLVDFEFKDVSFTLGGSALNIDSFQITWVNGLITKYLNSATPLLLVRSKKEISLTVTPVKNDNSKDVIRRTLGMNETTAQLTLKGLHNGTGGGGTNYTQLVIDFNRLSYIDHEDQGGRDELTMQPLNYVALKPDSASDVTTQTWSEVA